MRHPLGFLHFVESQRQHGTGFQCEIFDKPGPEIWTSINASEHPKLTAMFCEQASTKALLTLAFANYIPFRRELFADHLRRH
jgi:hypothetical protein